MKDPVEKEETYYVHKMNDLLEIGGITHIMKKIRVCRII